MGDLHLEDLVGVLLLELRDQGTPRLLDEPEQVQKKLKVEDFFLSLLQILFVQGLLELDDGLVEGLHHPDRSLGGAHLLHRGCLRDDVEVNIFH